MLSSMNLGFGSPSSYFHHLLINWRSMYTGSLITLETHMPHSIAVTLFISCDSWQLYYNSLQQPGVKLQHWIAHKGRYLQKIYIYQALSLSLSSSGKERMRGEVGGS